ncbi:MAG: prolyl oligopeptidase family serine peptidase [Deltaproteobacteria bacterium]|nr:prolyl oligopeptidase family serine peptidase [Deltaproteobacteria bacterium]
MPHSMCRQLGVIVLMACMLGCGIFHKRPGQTADTEVTSETGCAKTEVVPPSADPASASHPFKICSDAVATGAAPLIADFENCSIEVTQNEGRDGFWWVFDDGTEGTISLVAEDGAAHFQSADWSDWGSGVECHIAPVADYTDHCSYDASHYAGVRFKATGKGRVIFRVATVSNIAIASGGTCTRGFNCYDMPGERFVLTDDWQTIEMPFCRMKSEGWGGKAAPLNPSEVVGFHFIFYSGQSVDFWIDDFEFFSEHTAASPVSCEQPCPLALVQYPDKIVPQNSFLPLGSELTLHTFEQQTKSCGAITRRYLQYVPKGLPANSTTPVVIALHGSSTNAETFHTFLARGRLDELAERDKFIVVYGNAAPGAHSSDHPEWENTGSWRYDTYDDGQVDDMEYLMMVIEQLKSQSVIAGDNDIYLVGLSNGGGMVLHAAKQHPELFKGIAAFMPYDGWEPLPVPSLAGTGLTRVLFGIAPEDPGLSKGYDKVLKTLPSQWAAAMGLSADAILNPLTTKLPNKVDEGKEYSGNNANALRTRNSTVTQRDMSSPDGALKVRLLEFTRGGHLWPNPVQDTVVNLIEQYGFRNQDVDAADAVWSFFKEGK